MREGGELAPAAVAALGEHPQFAAAMRALLAENVRLYRGNRILNYVGYDRGRLIIGILALYLYVTRRDDDPGSGLTAQRLKGLCGSVTSRARRRPMAATGSWRQPRCSRHSCANAGAPCSVRLRWCCPRSPRRARRSRARISSRRWYAAWSINSAPAFARWRLRRRCDPLPSTMPGS